MLFDGGQPVRQVLFPVDGFVSLALVVPCEGPGWCLESRHFDKQQQSSAAPHRAGIAPLALALSGLR